MADISLRGVYDSAQRAFQKDGSGSARFEQDFINAVNRSINCINRDADLETSITRVTDADDDVTGLDVRYEDVLFEGIVYFLMKAGQKPAKGFERHLSHVKNAFWAGIDSLMCDLRHDQQDTNGTADDTYDIIGLGHLG